MLDFIGDAHGHADKLEALRLPRGWGASPTESESCMARRWPGINAPANRVDAIDPVVILKAIANIAPKI